jgi:hypothetical protein
MTLQLSLSNVSLLLRDKCFQFTAVFFIKQLTHILALWTYFSPPLLPVHPTDPLAHCSAYSQCLGVFMATAG